MITKEYLLTIIVPVYNVELYLSDCIESILAQSFDNFELLLIDDGSTDSSGAICDKYKKLDKRVRVFHTENKGVSSARNKGLDEARGKYISFVDSDDYIDVDTYEPNIRILEADLTIDFIQIPISERFCKSRIIEGKNNLFNAWIYSHKILTNYFGDKIFRRYFFETYRFPVGMRYEDRYLFSDILCLSNKVYISVCGKYFYRKHPGQITRQISTQLKKDMVIANLHTLRNMPTTCLNSQMICFWETYFLIGQLLPEKGSLNLKDQLKCFIPNLYNICFSNVPFGIKIRLFLLKIKYV